MAALHDALGQPAIEQRFALAELGTHSCSGIRTRLNEGGVNKGIGLRRTMQRGLYRQTTT